MKPSHEQLIALAREAGAGIGTSGRWLVTQEELERFAELVASAGESEPVAIVEVSVPHLRSIVVKAIEGSEIPPAGTLFYTHPAPSPAARVPMTDEQADNVLLDVMGFAVLDKEQRDTGMMIVRAVEAFHDITTKEPQ